MGSLDSTSSSRDKKNNNIGRGGVNPLVYLAIFLAVAALIIYIIAAKIIYKDKDQGVLEQIRISQLAEVSAVADYHADWLEHNLSIGARENFESIAAAVMTSAEFMPPTGDIVSYAWMGVHKGALRALFIVVAWWKFWLIAVVGFALWSVRSFKVWLGNDVLGRQTNGRLFYSGIRGDLKKIVANGTPDVQTPGLACPKYLSAVEVKRSAIGKVLDRYGLSNKTNLRLAGTILAYPKWPAFIALRSEGGLLEAAYNGASLAEHTALVLEAALSLRDTYVQYADNIAALTGNDSKIGSEKKLSAEEYVAELKFAFNRVLTTEWKLALVDLTPKELATIILAHEAGKVMAYKEEGPRLVRGSNFPQLCARAVLHSVAEYADEYNFNQRNTIRRSIIYGSRKSVFGPVKFLIDLSPQTRAARQWVELLMACPHELSQVSDEVELYGLICAIHDAWQKALMDDLMVSPADKLVDIIAHNTMAYVPFQRIMKYFRASLDTRTLNRLNELVAVVSERQQLAIAEGMATGTIRVPDYLKLFVPLSEQEIATITSQHGLDPDEVRAWSSLRVVLNYYSWLGRRVGDNKVPDNSIIFLATRRQKYETDMPTLVSECFAGMVAIRATRLMDRWGTLWSRKFDSVISVTAVEDMEEFEKFKRGESLDDVDIPTPDGASVG